MWYIFPNKVTCLCRSSVLILGTFIIWCFFLCWPTHSVSYTVQKIVFVDVTVQVLESVSSHLAFVKNFIQCPLNIILFNTCCLFLWLTLQSSELFPRFRGICYFMYSGWKRFRRKFDYHQPYYIVTNPRTLVLFLWNKCNKTEIPWLQNTSFKVLVENIQCQRLCNCVIYLRSTHISWIL